MAGSAALSLCVLALHVSVIVCFVQILREPIPRNVCIRNTETLKAVFQSIRINNNNEFVRAVLADGAVACFKGHRFQELPLPSNSDNILECSRATAEADLNTFTYTDRVCTGYTAWFEDPDRYCRFPGDGAHIFYIAKTPLSAFEPHDLISNLKVIRSPGPNWSVDVSWDLANPCGSIQEIKVKWSSGNETGKNVTIDSNSISYTIPEEHHKHCKKYSVKVSGLRGVEEVTAVFTDADLKIQPVLTRLSRYRGNHYVKIRWNPTDVCDLIDRFIVHYNNSAIQGSTILDKDQLKYVRSEQPACSSTWYFAVQVLDVNDVVIGTYATKSVETRSEEPMIIRLSLKSGDNYINVSWTLHDDCGYADDANLEWWSGDPSTSIQQSVPVSDGWYTITTGIISCAENTVEITTRNSSFGNHRNPVSASVTPC